MNGILPKNLSVNPARDVALIAIERLVERGPTQPAALAINALHERDARLAESIYRTAVVRWLTIERVLNSNLNQPKIEPTLRAVLITGAAQLLFMDHVPAHAVVDVAVEQARAAVREGAAKLTNAVLRRVADAVLERRETGGWSPANNLIPWRGGAIQLAKSSLIKAKDPVKYLSLATSHDRRLVKAWVEAFGLDSATSILQHSLHEPVTWLNTPSGFERWQGSGLSAHLADHGDRWVQDPTSAKPVVAAGEMLSGKPPGLIIDYCAGMGTKTRQLARTFPAAHIVATDTDTARLAELSRVFAGHDRVSVTQAETIGAHAGTADLLLLDVPCSNTGVLARRPEAKYRYAPRRLDSLTQTQKQIINTALPLLSPGGVLIYSTCSVEHLENRAIVDWLCESHGMRVDRDETTMPTGDGDAYHDGGYLALIRRGD